MRIHVSCLHGVGSPVGLVDEGVDRLHRADHVHAVLVVHRVGLRVRESIMLLVCGKAY
jgi:hypothetical protein